MSIRPPSEDGRQAVGNQEDAMTRAMTKEPYTEASKERALTFMAMAAGNSARASRELAAVGHHIPDRTIREWAGQDPERYERICTDVHTRLHHKMAAESEAIVAKASAVQHAYLDRMVAEVAEIPSKDLPKAFQSTAVATGIHTDKARLLRDEATTIVDDRTSAEVMRKLTALGVARPLQVDAQAVVETEGESPASTPQISPATREQTSS